MASLNELLRGRGTWLQRTLLAFLAVANGAIGAGLVLNKLGRLTLGFDPSVVAHFAAFAQASGAAIVLLYFLLASVPQLYSPTGSRIVKSHKWVYLGTGKRAGPATVKAVYEHTHHRTWAQKVQRERRILTVVWAMVALPLTMYGIYYIISQQKVQVLTQMSSFLGHEGLVASSWLLLALMGAAAVPTATLAYWDTEHSFSIEDMEKYEDPSKATVVARTTLAVGVVLLHVVIFIASFFPAVKAGGCPELFVALSFGSAVFWLIGAVVPDPGFTASYRLQRGREAAAEMAQNAVKTLFSASATRKERYAAAWSLLREPDVLTVQGKRQVAEALKVLSGRDFGQDYEAWRRWLYDQWV